jgi:hypothetical protein
MVATTTLFRAWPAGATIGWPVSVNPVGALMFAVPVAVAPGRLPWPTTVMEVV